MRIESLGCRRRRRVILEINKEDYRYLLPVTQVPLLLSCSRVSLSPSRTQNLEIHLQIHRAVIHLLKKYLRFAWEVYIYSCPYLFFLCFC